jgi:FKBP-type peptidyl-prolyl cis-trans isomerase
MVKSLATTVLFLLCSSEAAAFSLSTGSESKAPASSAVNSRRSFLSTSVATLVGGTSILSQAQPSFAAPEIITLPSGIKYAVTKQPADKKPTAPYKGDFVAIDYTGYLANGQIFDATHADGKSNALLFKLGTGSVIPGLDEMVANMVVGQKVQAIIPPSLAYGEKGVCLDDGECLIKPGSTLVYDIFLKRTSIPPP